MKVKMYEGGLFVTEDGNYVTLEDGEVLEIIEVIDNGEDGHDHYVAMHEPTSSKIILYEDEFKKYTPEMEMADRLSGACTAKKEKADAEKQKIAELESAGKRPNLGDEVRYTSANRDGKDVKFSAIDEIGTVIDVNYVTALHVMYTVLNKAETRQDVVVTNHPHGWYCDDDIQVLKSTTKEYEYYGVYSSRTDKVELESLNVYKSDTLDYAHSMAGNPLPSYLSVRKVILTVLPE